MAETCHRQPVEAGSSCDANPERYDAGRNLRGAGACEAGEYTTQNPAATVGEKHRGKPAEGSDSHPLTARDKNVFAKLDRTTRDADHNEGFDDALVRAAELMAVDHRDGEDQLDLLFERVH